MFKACPRLKCNRWLLPHSLYNVGGYIRGTQARVPPAALLERVSRSPGHCRESSVVLKALLTSVLISIQDFDCKTQGIESQDFDKTLVLQGVLHKQCDTSQDVLQVMQHGLRRSCQYLKLFERRCSNVYLNSTRDIVYVKGRALSVWSGHQTLVGLALP